MLNSAFHGWVSTWFYRSRTWSPANSARTHRVTSRSLQCGFLFWCQWKKFSSYLVAARKVTLCVIVDTRPLACNMTSLSPELIYLNPCVFLMSFALTTPFCFLVTPSGVLLCKVESIDRQDKVQSVLQVTVPCCSKSCFLNMVRFYKSEFRTQDYITQRNARR
jgi:hypothetical protein